MIKIGMMYAMLFLRSIKLAKSKVDQLIAFKYKTGAVNSN